MTITSKDTGTPLWNQTTQPKSTTQYSTCLREESLYAKRKKWRSSIWSQNGLGWKGPQWPPNITPCCWLGATHGCFPPAGSRAAAQGEHGLLGAGWALAEPLLRWGPDLRCLSLPDNKLPVPQTIHKLTSCPGAPWLPLSQVQPSHLLCTHRRTAKSPQAQPSAWAEKQHDRALESLIYQVSACRNK